MGYLEVYQWIFNTLTVKSIGLLAFWMGLLSKHNFMTPCIGHLENHGSLSYVDLLNVDIFHSTSEKSHSSVSPLISSENSLNAGNFQAHSVEYKFSKIIIICFKLKFYNWQQILLVVFLEVTGSIHSSLRKCLPDAQAWIIRDKLWLEKTMSRE